MADKEATVYIIDLGQSMADCNGGRIESDLDWSMKYVYEKISTTVGSNRKTWTVGVLGLRTDETDNALHRSGLEGYENISVLQDIGPMTLTSLKELQGHIKASSAAEGDAISAIVVAVRMIEEYTKKLKFNRKIVLVTDGCAPMDTDSLEDVSEKLNDVNIELTVIGVDFDDKEYGFKEEDKISLKQNNERLLKQLCDQCKNAVYGTMAEAVEATEIPRIKAVRPYKSYDGALTLGDPAEYASAATFQIERYTKTKLAAPPSANTVTVQHGPGAGSSQSTHTLDGDVEMGGTEFSAVKNEKNYKVEDASQPGGKRDVPSDELSKGYQYGRTVIHISESEWNITKIETKKGFSILGFMPFTSFEPFMSMGEANLIVAQKFNEEAEVALSSFINALYELESYAVARFVSKDGTQPQLLLLMPNPKLDADFECLYDIPLPFAEDVRSYQFPPLDKVLTITGNVLTKHRLLPNDALSSAMSSYVDSMDISVGTAADEGEYAPLDESYNPMVHRLNQVIRARAIHPDEPIGPPPDILLRYSHPPARLVEKMKPEVDALIDAAEVKKVPKKAQGKRWKETATPVSGLDIDALLGQNKRTKISSENAVPEFKQMLVTSKEISTIEDATKQMGAIVRQLIQDSFASLLYGQAQEKLRVMREELIDLDMPALYNSYIKALKKSILSGELNGDRREMWTNYIIGGRLGLITQQESEASAVKDDEASAFRK